MTLRTIMIGGHLPWILALWCLLTPAGALPFANNKKKVADKEEDDVRVRVRGAAATVAEQIRADNDSSKAEASLSSVIQQLYEDSSSPSLISGNALRDVIRREANTTAMQDFLASVRRSLHRHPELMYDLPFTSDVIQATLDELHIPFSTGWAKNTHPEVFDGPGGFGIVGHIGSMRADQPCIILRADMDALPIREATPDITYQSQQAGKMHACGHDGHVTMLLGAAALLKQVESSLPGTVRLVFQPAEEGGAGMKRMVEEGVVDLEPTAAAWAFGMHVWPTLPTGVVATKPGALMAATETFEIVLTGKGGHAAMPHLTRDPIVAASSFVMTVQTLVSRNLSPLEAGVVSVTHIATPGDAFNVIPATATLRGTMRSLSTESLLDLRAKVEHMVQSTAAMYGCHYQITFMPDYYPPTVNDPALFHEFSSAVGALVSRQGTLREAVPTMGGEDFAFLAQKIPSTFFFIGQGTGGDPSLHLPRTDYGLHHPSFALDENVLPIGVELHTNLALRALKALSKDNNADLTNEEEL